MVVTESEDAFTLVCKSIRNGEAVIWAGAGFSAYAGYPAGTEFARVLAEEIGEFQSTEPLILPDVAERYETIKGRDALLNRIDEFFGKEPLNVETHQKLSLIKHIPFIVTTNYDRLFEAAYGDGIISIASEQELLKTQGHRFGDCRQIVYKPHGDVDHLDKIVITRKDYKQFDRNSFLWKRISVLLAEYSLIFIGYSLNDKNTRSLLDNIFKRLGPRDRPYIIITKKAEAGDQKWYKKRNVRWIEKDAVEAITEISDYVARYSFIDSHNDPAKMMSRKALFKSRNICFDTTESKNKQVISLRPVDPSHPLTIQGSLQFAAAMDAPELKDFDDVMHHRKSDPVELCGPTCKVRLFNEVNGILLIDPDSPYFDSVTLYPQPEEEMEVDLQLRDGSVRMPNVLLQRHKSDTNPRMVFTTPKFTMIIDLIMANRSGTFKLKITEIRDIDVGLHIYTFFKRWLDGEPIQVISSNPENLWELPRESLEGGPDEWSQIHFWYRFFSDLSEIQKKCCMRLPIPKDGFPDDDLQNIADAAALLKGWRKSTGDLTLHVGTKGFDVASVLTTKPMMIRCHGPTLIETFEIFGIQVPIPFYLDGRGVVLSNLEEARAEVERGADRITLRYDGSVGNLFQRYAPLPPDDSNKEMKSS